MLAASAVDADPLYATAVGVGLALVAFSLAEDWSGARTFVVALVVAPVYVLLVAAPLLIREQLDRAGTEAEWRNEKT